MSGQVDPGLPKESGRTGIAGLGVAAIGLVPLVFYLFVLMVADDHALLRLSSVQASLQALLVISIPLLPILIGSVIILVGYGLSRKGRLPWWGALIAAVVTILAALLALSWTVALMFSIAVLGLFVCWLLHPERRWARWVASGIVAVWAVTVSVLFFGGDPSQTARDIALRAYRQQVLVVTTATGAPAVIEVHVINEGDRTTTVVVDRKRVVEIDNDHITHRITCVPSLGSDRVAPGVGWMREISDQAERTPSCAYVMKRIELTPRGIDAFVRGELLTGP
jgi:hypothetical protein